MERVDQHTVPQGYLKHFHIEGRKKFVFCLKIKSPYPNPKVKDVSVSSICYIPDYYTVETDFLLQRYGIQDPYFIEKQGFPYERKLSSYFSKLLELRELNIVEATDLIEMLLSMKMRNQAMLALFEDDAIIDQNLKKQHKALRESVHLFESKYNLSRQEIEDAVEGVEQMTTEMFRDPKHRRDLYREILLEQVFNKKRNDTLVKMLLGKRFFIFETKKTNPFITNDNPGATLIRGDRIVNTQFSDWHAFSFPISPDFMFMILNQDDHTLFANNRIKVVEHRGIDKEFVDYANKACIHNANEMIISNSKAVLEDLKKQYRQFYVMPLNEKSEVRNGKK